MNETIKIQLFSDIGINEVFMARLVHFLDRILVGLPGLKNREDVRQALMRAIFDGLEPAFRSLRDLRKKWADEKVPQQEKTQLISSIYTFLTIAYKDRFQHTAKLMGYDIGFIFLKDKEFEAGLKKFIELHPKMGQDVPELIKDERASWLSALIDTRNLVIDHAAGKDPNAVKPLLGNLNLESAEIVFDNCWRSMEDFLIIFSVDILYPKFGIQLLQTKEYAKNKDHHERMGWFSVDDTAIKNKTAT